MAVKGLKVNSLNMSDDVLGLILLTTQTFSGVTSVSLPASTFTTTYNRFLIQGNLSCTGTNVDVNGRLRTAGTDNAGSIYNTQYISVSSTSVSGARGAAGNTLSDLGGFYQTANRDNSYINIEIRKPAQTDYTTGKYGYSTVSEGNITYNEYVFGTTVTTSFDSLSLIASTGNISGTISCYAYNV
jgi:hypothetical protein